VIAIIDSGVGGLSILRPLSREFPDKRILYFADSLYFPYGEKTKEDLVRILESRFKFFLKNGAKLVVIACNTATISAIDELRQKFQIPIIGIEPAVKPATECSKNGRVGLIATECTVSNHTTNILNNIRIIKRASKDLATKIEEDLEAISDEYIKGEFDNLISKGVDTVALGCTHYHFIIDRLQSLYPQVLFITPERPVIKRIKSVISELNIELEDGEVGYLASAKPDNLSNFIKKIGLEDDPIVELAE
jgi:glutamate racemase